MRAGLILALIGALLLTGCGATSRTHVFEPTRDGAMAAGERILALPEGMHGRYVAHLRPETITGLHATFYPLRRFSAEAIRSEDPVTRHGFCERAGLGDDCDPESLIAGVFVVDAAPDTAPGTIFEPSVAGIEAAQVVSKNVEGVRPPLPAFLMTERAPEAETTAVSWNWERFNPVFMQPDYACVTRSGVYCIHRDDIASLAIRDSDYRVHEVTAVGEDLAASYAQAQALAQAADGQIWAEIKVPTVPSRMRAHLASVDSIDETGICGYIISSRLAGSQDQCLAFTQIERFVVTDRMRQPHEAALDLAVSPFRFLGAIAVATAMGGAGN